MEVGKLFFCLGGAGGMGWFVCTMFFFGCFFGDLSKRLLGITMKLIRVSPY